MDESQKTLVSTVLATVLLIGLIGATLSGVGGQSTSDEKYKDILGNLDEFCLLNSFFFIFPASLQYKLHLEILLNPVPLP
ncbi:hypothetical protein AKJ55_01255, partial [candidate division MSBL1 archaeon SCGC-AAA382M17]